MWGIISTVVLLEGLLYDAERNLLAIAKFLVNFKYDFDSTLKLILSHEERKGK